VAVTTDKHAELKAKRAKEIARAKEIEQSNRVKEVDYRNKVNKRADEVQRELINFFRPLIGKKIRTISGYGDWSKLVKGKLNLYLDDLWTEGFRVLCRPSCGTLYFEIDTTYQYDQIGFNGYESHSTSYVKADFYVGSWDESTGNLYKVKEEENISERRTDWTVEELAATRKKIKEMDEELRNLKHSIWEFK
jgi:hypothetical protein